MVAIELIFNGYYWRFPSFRHLVCFVWAKEVGGLFVLPGQSTQQVVPILQAGRVDKRPCSALGRSVKTARTYICSCLSMDSHYK